MDKNEYFKHPGLNHSSLSDFEISPAHYLYRKNNPDPDTKATLIGSAYHYLCFEPGKFDMYMIVLHEHQRPVKDKDYRNTENKEWKAAKTAEAERTGRQIISSDDYGIACDMYEALEKCPEAFELIRSKHAEYEKFATWEWNGIVFKRKTDIWHPDYQADLKSVVSADIRAVERTVFEYKYYRQGGMYADGDRVINDSIFFNPFYIIAQEKTPPYGVSLHLLTDEVLDYGAQEYRKLAIQFDECRKTNKWPGYSYKYQDYNKISLPKYLRNE